MPFPPSVSVGAGVELEHFVNPLGVEGDVDEERRLRRGALGPLDAHAYDDLALVLLANQRAAVVFLGGGGESGEGETSEKNAGSGVFSDPYFTHAFPSLAAGAYPALPGVPFDLRAHAVVDHRHGDGVQGLLVSCVWIKEVKLCRRSRNNGGNIECFG